MSLSDPDIFFANLAIMISEKIFSASERYLLYDFTETTADAGGLLGLFMGVSLLSIVEFGYCVLAVVLRRCMRAFK